MFQPRQHWGFTNRKEMSICHAPPPCFFVHFFKSLFNYNISPFTFLPPKSHILLPILLQINDLFFINYYCMYILRARACVYIFLSITFWVHISYLYSCFGRLLFDSGQPIGVLFPDEESCSQLSSVACSSLCRLEPSWPFPQAVWYICWCPPCSAYILVVKLVILYECSFWCHKETVS